MVQFKRMKQADVWHFYCAEKLNDGNYKLIVYFLDCRSEGSRRLVNLIAVKLKVTRIKRTELPLLSHSSTV